MAAQKTVALVAFAAVAVSMLTSVLALNAVTKTVNHNGTVQAINVGIYQDIDCTQALSTASWGILVPGTSSNMTIYVKNLGNAAVILNMTVNSWSPSVASNYMTCTWNREGLSLNPGSKTQAILTLALSASTVDVTNFSFVTVIKGTQV